MPRQQVADAKDRQGCGDASDDASEDGGEEDGVDHTHTRSLFIT